MPVVIFAKNPPLKQALLYNSPILSIVGKNSFFGVDIALKKS